MISSREPLYEDSPSDAERRRINAERCAVGYPWVVQESQKINTVRLTSQCACMTIAQFQFHPAISLKDFESYQSEIEIVAESPSTTDGRESYGAKKRSLENSVENKNRAHNGRRVSCC